MHLNNIKSPKKTYLSNNINDYFIQIDYFDKRGTIKYKNNVPLKYVFDQKSINKIKPN
tara:strand:- start:174 stop:347 length:174 start_codon:yes stop_codon:yes gene_type:complete